jgi:hypothetical protein
VEEIVGSNGHGHHRGHANHPHHQHTAHAHLPAHHPAHKRAEQQLEGGGEIVRQSPTMRRRLVSGVPSTLVTSGSVADITIQPQEMFRIERIIVPSDIAFSFIFTDIKVGQASQLVAAGQLPCGAFTEVAVDSYVSFATANVGNVVILSVQNIDSSDQTFRAMLLGTAAV